MVELSGWVKAKHGNHNVGTSRPKPRPFQAQDVNEAQLEQVFRSIGPVTDLHLMRTVTGNSRGMGHVTYQSCGWNFWLLRCGQQGSVSICFNMFVSHDHFVVFKLGSLLSQALAREHPDSALVVMKSSCHVLTAQCLISNAKSQAAAIGSMLVNERNMLK